MDSVQDWSDLSTKNGDKDTDNGRDNGDDELIFFVRLSTRSPKDSCVKTPRFSSLVKQHLQELDTEREPMAVIRALNQSMQVKSAPEAMAFVMNSQRAYYDLFRSLLMMDEKLKKKKERSHELMPDQKIIVRLFHRTRRPELEFRVFVSGGRVTAITQYFKSCYLGDDIVSRYIPYIEASIMELSGQVSERIQEDHALDVLVELTENEIDDGNSNSRSDDTTAITDFHRFIRSHVIEINPFSQQTASGLFRWDVKEDEMILRGESNYEFRYVREPCSIAESRSKLSDDVRQVLQQINPIEVEEQVCEETDVVSDLTC